MALRKKSIGLFQALSDKKSMDALVNARPAGSFKEFLKQKGEYPYKDDEDITVGFRARKLFGMRVETLLAVALAFGISNVVSFTLGAWNTDKAALGQVTGLPAAKPGVDEEVHSARQAADPLFPSQRREIPPPLNAAREQADPAGPAAPQRQQAPVDEAKYTIRAITLDGHMKDRAAEIEKFFKDKGFSPVRAREIGDKIVIEAGAFASIGAAESKDALGKVKSLFHKYDSFRDAYFVRLSQ